MKIFRKRPYKIQEKNNSSYHFTIKFLTFFTKSIVKATATAYIFVYLCKKWNPVLSILYNFWRLKHFEEAECSWKIRLRLYHFKSLMGLRKGNQFSINKKKSLNNSNVLHNMSRNNNNKENLWNLWLFFSVQGYTEQTTDIRKIKSKSTQNIKTKGKPFFSFFKNQRNCNRNRNL